MLFRSGEINEIGLYPSTRSSTNNYDSKFISDFNNYLDWTTTEGYNPDTLTSNMKIGDTMLKMESNSTSAREYKATISPIDISGYSINDSIAIAYKKADNNLSKIRVKFYSSASAYYYVDFTPESGTGDKLQSLTLNSLFSNYTPSPNLPDPSSITKIGVEKIGRAHV